MNNLQLNTSAFGGKIRFITLFLFATIGIVNVGLGQTAIPNATPVTQNFDAMAATTTLPTNWRMNASTTSPTWSGASGSVTQQASSGSPTAGGTYNFGSSASERAVGAMTSVSFASPNNLLGFFQNTNASNLTSLTIAYNAERYRINTAAASVQFFYSTNGTTWTAVTAGNIATTSFPTWTSAYNFTTGTVINKTGIAISGLNIATNGSIYLRWNINTTGASSQGIGIDNISVTAGFAASSSISSTGSLSALSTTYGTPSLPSTVTVSGTGLMADITATAPTGFQVSNDGTTYGATTTFAQSGGTASGTLSVRLAAAAAVTGSYNTQNIVLSSTGATSVNVTTAASGNSVTAAALTITGVGSTNKVYNASAIGSLTGTAAYSGLQNGESFSVTGTPVATFAQATVGTGIAVTVTGYTAPSTNYTLTQPTVSNADITAKGLTISGLTANNKVFDGNTTATLSGTAALVGVETADIGNVTISGTPTANFAQSATGTGIAVTVTGYTLSGSAAGNYSVSQPTGLTADITAAALSINGITANNRDYNGLTAANLAGTPAYVGLQNGESFSVTGTPIANFDNKNVGTSKPVTVTGYTAPSSNYTVTQPSLTANITAAALTISGASAANKLFDGNTTATLSGTLSGAISPHRMLLH